MKIIRNIFAGIGVVTVAVGVFNLVDTLISNKKKEDNGRWIEMEESKYNELH